MLSHTKVKDKASKSAVDYKQSKQRMKSRKNTEASAAEPTDTFGNAGEEEAKGHEVDEFYHQKAQYLDTDLDHLGSEQE